MAGVPNIPSVCSVYARKVYRVVPEKHRYTGSRFRRAVPDFCASVKRASESTILISLPKANVFDDSYRKIWVGSYLLLNIGCIVSTTSYCFLC